MKKNIHIGIVILLAFSLAFSVHSLAADMTLTLRTEDGFSVTTNTPVIKGFAIDNDNNVTVILKEPPILDFGDPYPQITIDNPSSCTKTSNAYVKANPATTFSFTVRTTTTGATLSSDTAHGGTSVVPDYYGAEFVAAGSSGVFSWNTAGTHPAPSGRYLAVFTATPSTCPLPEPSTCTSQLVVMINISQQYKLTLTAGTGGVVSPAGETSYDPGTQVQISATPSQGNSFTGWSDAGTGNPRTVVMDQDRAIAATFAQIPTYTLQVNSSDSGVPITVSQADNNGQQSGNAPFTRTYNQNTVVTLTAPSSYNSKNFSSWTGADSVSATQATVTMTGNKTVTVNYASSTPAGTPLSWNTRTSLNLSAGSEQVYIANVDTSDKIYLSVSIIGITNGTDATYTWTFPDGAVFNGAVLNTSVNGILLLRTRTYGYANIPYDYIPAGNHVLRIKANASSSFVIRTAIY